MAERRMFTKKVTDDDNFMALSSSAQALYLHLSMSADDDGFCNQVAISMFKAHASVQDLQALLEKRYIYQFDNGVIVIKHWRMANALRKDRYTPTAFQDELAKLDLKDNGSYTWLPDGCQTVATCLPQDRLGKDRLEKDSKNILLLGAETAPSPKAAKLPAVISISLNDNSEYPITQPDIDSWAELYPAVDIMQELRKMKGWANANPTKRKTAKGIKRFINSWLAKEQDKYHPTAQTARVNGQQPQQQSSNIFFDMFNERREQQ